ncbi:MAG: C25 family cysteine peptidase [Acidobacteriota bacterium]
MKRRDASVHTSPALETGQKNNKMSRAIVASLCCVALAAGIAISAYVMLRTRDSKSVANQDLTAPAGASVSEPPVPPAPDTSKTVPNSRDDQQRRKKVPAGSHSGSVSASQMANRIMARVRMIERASRRQTLAPAEIEIGQINPNREALPQHLPIQSVAPMASADPNTAKTKIAASPLKEAVSNAATAEPQGKGPEFPPRIGINSATTTSTTDPSGVANANALQEPSPSLKVEISAPDPVVPSEFNGDLRDLPQFVSPEEKKQIRPDLELEAPEPGKKTPLPGARPAALPQVEAPAAPMPGPSVTFDAMNLTTNGNGHPPDTVGDVGPGHFVQAVNTSIGIYNKTGGPAITTFTFTSLWTGAATGTPCDTTHFGDPTVIYSRQHNRFIVADFSWTSLQNGPYYECIAVSKTSNPVTGGWWLYGVRADDAAHPWLPDYPKMGIWPDGLYMTANMFDCLNATCSSVLYKEVRAYAFNLVNLVNGTPLQSIVVDTNSVNRSTLLPSNYRGTAPPAGRENLVVGESRTLFAWEVFKFHVDYVVPANSTFTGPTNVSQTIYALAAGIVPQPAPGNNTDTLAERAMMQNQYRNIAGVESLWVNHTTGTSDTSGTGTPTPTGIQWAQINVTGGTINTTPVQEQIFNNGADGLNRFVGSLAVDHAGNMALGYTASSASVAPDIRYVGRLSTDPLNTLPQTEVTMLPAVARSVQTGSCGGTCTRWGDYSAMTIDPVDECTFWYTHLYFPVQGANWVTRIGSFKFPTCVSLPTEAKMKTFTADRFDDGRVLLRWSSAYESDNLGYNVYREVNGQRTKINPQIIAGSALVTGPNVALSAGKSYDWADQFTTSSATRYWLENIDLKGNSSWNGPISLDQKTGKAPTTDQSLLLGKIGMSQAQTTLGQGSVPVERRAGIASLTPAAMQLQTDVAGQAAMKLAVKHEGWYRASQRDLVNAGFSAKVDPRKLQLYVDGRAVPMIVPGEQDGRFDPSDSVEFFGVGIDSPVTDSHVYWLAAGTQAGARITSSRGTGQTPAANGFQSSVERKDRTIYFSALKNGEAENFFGPVIGSTSVDQALSLTNLSPAPGGSASLEVTVQGVTATAHQVRVTLNGAVLGTISFSGQARGSQRFAVPQSSLREGVNSLQLVSLGGSADISLADSARVTYWHNYRADSNQLRLTAQGGQQVTLSGFTSSAVRVMDVTDACNPQELLTTAGGGKAGPGALTVNVTGAGQRTLYAFAGDQAKTAAPKFNTLSNWRQAGRGADFVIFTRQDLMASLGPLASLRQKDGLSVAVVNIEDVYDEFSFGNKTPQAIKDFLQFAKSNWQPAPRFALLAGDASYDSKNYLGYGDSDLVPTKLIDTRYMEAASDDWFSEFNDGSPQMAMGRLPVRNASEAAALVAKITGYEGSRVVNSVVLASDSFDGFDFAAANNLVRPLIPVGTKITEVLRGSADDATVKAQLLSSINSGAKVVSYSGHGSTNQWRGNILTNDDARSLTNGKNLPLFVMMTCLNGYFNDPVLDSLSESLLKAANGGAVSVWASTAQADPVAQSALNQAFYRELFGPTPLTVGEAASRAKSAVTDSDVRRTWILFGDPAMRIK